jgi:uncharacterized lipoprotein YmbA
MKFVRASIEMKLYLTLMALIILGACSSAPVPRTYVLSTPAEAIAGVHNEAGQPVIEIPTVSMPDYLDTPDIFLRDGRNELRPSTTGRWGERLSLGVTHALEVALGRRLPGFLVTHTPMQSGQPARSVLVDVDGFDVQPDGRCVLTAHWTITGGDASAASITERGTFVTMVAATPSREPFPDAAVVAAMAAAVDQLADRIANNARRGASPRTK